MSSSYRVSVTQTVSGIVVIEAADESDAYNQVNALVEWDELDLDKVTHREVDIDVEPT